MENIYPLPPPQKELDFPLMQALSERKTTRKWSKTPLTDQELANLLWAGCGIARPATATQKSKRTSPSGTNSQEISIYAALEKGIYRYDENQHQLTLHKAGDFRYAIGTQSMMQAAPIGLIYVADLTKMKVYHGNNREQKLYLASADTGFISENIYLYCAAAKLATAVLGLVDREKLHALMELSEHEIVTFTQVVGRRIE